MKKLTGLKVIIGSLFLAILIVVPVRGYAGWELYDDFDDISGLIDWNRWGIYGDWSGANADRSIVGGRLEIILREGPPESRYGLVFKQHVEELKAIRAKVTIDDCAGDCRARIKTDWPLDDSAYSYQQGLNIYGSEGRINGYLNLYLTEAPAPPGDPWWSWYTGLEFNPPDTIIDETFVVTVWFTDDEAKFSVSEHGSIEYAHKEGFTSSAGRSYSIGVKSWNGEGTCTVYYDDIEVFIGKKK